MSSKCLESLENGSDAHEEPLQPSSLLTQQRSAIERAKDTIIGDSRFSKRAKISAAILLALCVVLLVIMIVLAASWPASPNSRSCIAPDCLRLAAEQVEWMDPSADQCSAAREWSCQGWIEDHFQHLQAKFWWSIHEDLELEELRKLRDAITGISNVGMLPQTLEWNLKHLYESCMDENDIESRNGKDYLKNILKEMGDWNILGNWQQNAWNWKTTLTTLQTEYGITPLFSITLMRASNGTVTFHVKPDGFGLPDLTFYALSLESDEIKAYRRLLVDVVLRMNATPDDANNFASNVIDLEQKLAMMIIDKNEMSTHIWVTTNELDRGIYNTLASIFPDIEIRNDMKVLVTSPHYLKEVINTASETTLSNLNDYFTWTIIRRFLPLMPKSFLDNVMEFETHITGKTKELNRWEFCTRFIRNAAPLAAQSYIENSTMTRETKKVHKAVHNTFNVIKSKAEDLISASKEIPLPSKEVILKKLKSLKIQIGLQPADKTKGLLKDFYRNRLVVQNGDFFKSYQYAMKNSIKFTIDFRTNEDFSVLNDISKSLLLTKATYNSYKNFIILPTSLVSGPYFNVQYPQSVKYARLGITLAEAILESVMENGTFPTEQSLSCLVSEIADLMPPKDLFERNNISSTLSQSLASKAYVHMLAVKLAFDCSHIDKADRNGLPVFEEFSGDKLFALTYAQTLCSVSTEHRRELDLIRARINGETMFKVIWPHMADMQKALRCPKKKKHCVVSF